MGLRNAKTILNKICSARMANKALENSTKPLLDSSDVVQTVDYAFSPITKHEQEGDSGSLLLAKHKKIKDRLYFVKHEFTDCACNEFVYTKLVQAMGYHMPDVVLFQLSINEKRRCFKTEYVIGAKYLDIIDPDPSFEKIKKEAYNWQEYFAFAALYVMTGEGDGLEVVLAGDKNIYRVDTTDAFHLSKYHLDYAGIDLIIDGCSVNDTIKKQLLSFDLENVFSFEFCNSLYEKCMQLDAKACEALFFEPFVRIQDISSDYIDSFLNTLCYFYPDFIGDYFKLYIDALKKQSQKYLKNRS